MRTVILLKFSLLAAVALVSSGEKAQCTAALSIQRSEDIVEQCNAEAENDVIAGRTTPIDKSSASSDGTETSANVDLINSFRKSPTNGQHLMLMPRHSAYVIQLVDAATYRLRQMQQLHSVHKDDLMDVAPWDRPRRVSRKQQLTDRAAQRGDKNQTRISSGEPLSLTENETVPMVLKSHPGRAIVPIFSELREPGFMLLGQENYIDLGVGAEDAALKIRLKTVQPASRSGLSNSDLKRYELESESGSFLIVSADVVEGAPVTLTTLFGGLEGEEMLTANAAFITDCDHRCQFIVNTDGSLSPASATHLAVGIAPYPAVTLLPRDSPHRFLFQDAERFWSAPAPVNGTPMVLSSHPGLAVVPISRRSYGAFGLLEMQHLGVGPAQNALHLYSLDFSRHHQFLLFDNMEEGMGLMTFNMQLERGTAVRLVRYNLTESTQWIAAILSIGIRSSDNATWIINDEGSISPLLAPHLALGCEYIVGGQADRLVTSDQRRRAQVLAKAHLYKKAGSHSTASLMTPEMLRYIHVGIYVLLLEGVAQNLSFIMVMTLLVLVKIVPWQIWATLIIRLWFGTAALLFCYGFWFGVVAVKMLRRWIKPKRQDPALPAEEQRRHII
jgi:hypothetical protein